MTKFFKIPFATTGDKTTVPNDTQTDGTVSYEEGYGADYSLPRTTDPAALNIEREKMNEIFFDITGALNQIQTTGAPNFITSADNGGIDYPYGIGAIVRYAGATYVSLTDVNTSLPTDPLGWTDILDFGGATGPITIAGGVTSITSQTGTGSKFVVDDSPTLITPIIGVATATSVNKVHFTQPATSSTLTLADGKTLTVNSSITLNGTDGTAVNISSLKKEFIGFSALSPVVGQQGTYSVFAAAGTITGWVLLTDTGVATVRVWKVAAGTASPTVSNNINTSGLSLVTGTAIISSTVSDFTTTAVAAYDLFAFEVTALSGSPTKLFFVTEITVT